MAALQVEATDYERALARAQAEGLQIIGRGMRKSDGAHVVFVTGKTRASYQVIVFPLRLVCNCEARGMCKHRALVHADLAERARRSQTVKPAPVKRVECRGVNDTRAISIWK